jgi:hypothetical protein
MSLSRRIDPGEAVARRRSREEYAGRRFFACWHTEFGSLICAELNEWVLRLIVKSFERVRNG